MNIKKKHPAVSTLSPVVSLLFTAIIFSGCARKMNFGISQVDPGADGFVKLSSDKNNNTVILVKINHLAPAERLNPPGKLYVVWMDTENNGVKNIGQLKNMSLLFSRARRAELKTVTPFKPRTFFVTAEDSATVAEPRAEMVLRTK